MARLHSRTSVADIDARMTTLASSSICSISDFRPGQTGNKTHENRTMRYLKIASSSAGERLPVFLMAGLHAREVAQPPALVNFAEDLINAYNVGGSSRNPITVQRFTDNRTSPPTVYPEYIIPASDVKMIVERLDLYIAPLCNPDGRQFVLADPANVFWRKNRRPAPSGATCNPPAARIGVDLNRNFDIAWDFDKYYSAAVTPAHVGASIVECDNTFRGPSAKSEPEVQNVQWLIDTKKIKFFADCHSQGRLILHPWAIEDNQSSDSTRNFRNANWDRGGSSGERDGFRQTTTNYGEYFPNGSPEKLLKKHRDLGDSIRDAIRNSAGSNANARLQSTYTRQQSAELDFNATGGAIWGTPGGSDDYAFSRQFVSGGPDLVYSFTFEFGHPNDDGFSPLPTTTYKKVEREIYVALHSYLKYAAAWAAPKAKPGCAGCSKCFIATATLGESHPDVNFLRNLRDEVLKTTTIGRKFMDVVEKIYYSFSPQLAHYLASRPLSRSVVRRGVVKPVIWQIRCCAALLTRSRNRRPGAKFLVSLLIGLGIANLAVLGTIIYLLIAAILKRVI